MESGTAEGKIGVLWINDVSGDGRFFEASNFGFDVFGGVAHKFDIAIDVNLLGGVFWESGEFVSDGLVEVVEFAGGDFVLELNSV